ncbi:hypothetical protein WDU94_009763 [Cyamophila willieti]
MSSERSSMLFACSKCFSRHPFEELSAGQQLCKECRGHYPVVKCTYCRSEFQQTVKNSTSTICKKCEQNVKQYGRPSACEYCNIIAAFIGNKCQRCSNCEQKYGPPVNCEQCKQKCAFDRKDDDKKIDGKLLCWLCTLSFKRALAKSKQSESERRAHMKLSAQHAAKHKEVKLRSHNRRPKRPDVTKLPPPSEDASDSTLTPPAAKSARLSSSHRLADIIDPNSSDHVVAMTQLKEKNAGLLKQISLKDALILTKDKMITELKANQFEVEKEFRKKMKDQESHSDKKVETLMNKIKSLQKEVATLSKGAKKNHQNNTSLVKEAVKESSGSETASPSIS